MGAFKWPLPGHFSRLAVDPVAASSVRIGAEAAIPDCLPTLVWFLLEIHLVPYGKQTDCHKTSIGYPTGTGMPSVIEEIPT
jgi:hypothetical protein